MTKIAQKIHLSQKTAENFRGQLLDWYGRDRRILPWRAAPGERADPYHVWLSEIMLQQTTVAAVIPYFTKFLDLWKRVEDLAAAAQEDVMREWAGLGYYARARNLHKCAGVVASEHGSVFPDTQEALKALPGIGDYTSAAIAAIAFGKETVVVDGNIERVMARVRAVEEPLPASKPLLKAAAADYFAGAGKRAGDFAQALMDLGAGICTPKSPSCLICPVAEHCQAREMGIAETLPRKAPKKAKPQKYGYVYWIENERGEILTEIRAEKGMLGGMRAFPTSDWDKKKNKISHVNYFPRVKWEALSGQVRHSFTHFDLTLDIFGSSIASSDTPDGYHWVSAKDLKTAGLPTLFKKVLKFRDV